MPDKDYLLEWQRKFDPSHFNKSRGAQYHTAPSVIFPGAAEYPDDLPDDAVTILFYIDSTCWIMPLTEKIVLDKPEFVEREAKGKAKHGPVFVMDVASVYASIPVNSNYYWAAQVMSCPENQVLRATFIPGKVSAKTGKSNIKCVVTFLPEQA